MDDADGCFACRRRRRLAGPTLPRSADADGASLPDGASLADAEASRADADGVALGIEHGVVAVTKADAVDDERSTSRWPRRSELVPSAEVVPVSAKTGAGLDDLRAALARAADVGR